MEKSYDFTNQIIKNPDRYRLRELLYEKLRGQMKIVAAIVFDFIREGKDAVFIPAVVKGRQLRIVGATEFNEFELESLHRQTMAEAVRMDADSILFGGLACRENVDFNDVPSPDSGKDQCIRVEARNKSEKLILTQNIYRHGKQLELGAAKISSVNGLWMDHFDGHIETLATC